MRKLQNFLLVALAAAAVGMIPKAEAGLISAPMALRGMIHYIRFDGPTLPPMAFTQFYDKCPILKSDVPADVRASRLALAELTARTLARGLSLLGIEVPERM